MVFYQIYPLSFKDSNGDGKGDIAGIIEKLDYLDHGGGKNSLGVDGIWLCPVYKSPMKDGGYDVSDFRAIDPVFGNMADFEKLVGEVHRRGMKIIIDFVANHTSDKHPWFLESKENRVNEKRDWYIWRDPKPGSVTAGSPQNEPQGVPPNNWLSVFGGSAWTFDENTGQYYLHNFLREQPDLNWRNPEVRRAMMAIMEFWMGRGVDGFRVDAMNHFIEDEKLRDDPPNPLYIAGKHNPYRSLRHTHSKGEAGFAVGGIFFTEFFKKFPDAFIVSEAYADVDEMIKMYDSIPSENYMPFNFNLATIPWGARNYKKFVDEYEARLAAASLSSKVAHRPNYVLGNHDLSRVAFRLDPLRARLSAFLQFTLRGTPFIYYGEELGMSDVHISKEQVQDQFEKNIPGLELGRDPARTPMQWDDSANAGFSGNSFDNSARNLGGNSPAAEPWLPVSPDYKEVNVACELADPHSMLSLYRTLIRLRRELPALSHGSYLPRISQSESVFSFARESGGERLLVLANLGDDEATEKIEDDGAEILCNSPLDRSGEKIHSGEIKLRAYEAVLIKI